MVHVLPTTLDEDTPLVGKLRGPASLKGSTLYVYMAAILSAIGGFLFGYDTGIISGAMIFIRDVFQLSVLWQEAIVSSTLLVAWLFAIVSGTLTTRLGRKPVIIGSSLIFILGSVLMGVAPNKLILLLGRLVVGAGVGLSSMSVPMYIAEVAPPAIRGQLTMINMCFVTFGQFVASSLAYGFSFLENGHEWRYMLGVAALPAALQFVAFLAMPESPRWLITNGHYEEARRVLAKMRPKGADTGAEFEAIRNSCIRHETEESEEPQRQSVFVRIMSNRAVRKALLVGCLLQMAQQVSGINTVMYYTASIFEMAGVYSKRKALLLSSGTAFVNFFFTAIGFPLVERLGRRKLLLNSLFGVTVGLIILAAGFQIAFFNSPEVDQVLNSTYNAPCSAYLDCSACTQNPQCGFCFSSDEAPAPLPATCLRVDQLEHSRSLLGNCTTGPSPQHVFAYEWCPSQYSWLITVGMILYLAFFAFGLGPMPWTINSEIYPLWARSWCLSASTGVCWFFNLLVSMTFLSLTNAITKQGAFYLYAGCSASAFLYFLFVLPETRGKSLEELENIFARNPWNRRQSAVGEPSAGAATSRRASIGSENSEKSF